MKLDVSLTSVCVVLFAGLSDATRITLSINPDNKQWQVGQPIVHGKPAAEDAREQQQWFTNGYVMLMTPKVVYD